MSASPSLNARALAGNSKNGSRYSHHVLPLLQRCAVSLVVSAWLACWGLHTTTAATLQELIDGATLTVGNSRFSHWQLIHLDATAAQAPNLAQITVVGLNDIPSNPGLQLTANNQLATTGIHAIELELKFRVDALGGTNSFTAHLLQMGAIGFGGGTGQAVISAEAVRGDGGDLGPTVVIADDATNFQQLLDTHSFPAQLQLFVQMNIYVAGLALADTVNLGGYTQRFAQTGPPGVLGDYNLNGVVDAADYVTWRDNRGSLVSLPNDNTNGVAADDYARWRSRFGQTSGSGAGELTAVPEPAAGALMIFMFVVASTNVARQSLRRRRNAKSPKLATTASPRAPGSGIKSDESPLPTQSKSTTVRAVVCQ